MPVCTICKKQFGSTQVRVGPCPSCGFDPNSPEASVAKVIQRRKRALDIRADANARAILESVGPKADNAVAYGLVEANLKRVLFLHGSADVIRNLVADAPHAKRQQRLDVVDAAIKRGDAAAWLEPAKHPGWIENPDAVREYCREGWEEIVRRWRSLSPADRRHFRGLVFEHDKGYPQTMDTALSYVSPGQLGLEGALIEILTRDTETDVFDPTKRVGGRKMVGTVIRDGWPRARAEQRDYFWCWLLGKIGEKYDLVEIEPILAKIRSDRQAFVTQLAQYGIPRQAVTDLLDALVECGDGPERKVRSRAEAVWGAVMGF